MALSPNDISLTINDWSMIRSVDNPYQAPELATNRLHGKVEIRGKTKMIRTATVLSAEGRVATTASGSRYRLGRINPEYRRFLRTVRPDWDWRNPIANK